MDWRLGTMGLSYADWAGAFYPRGMKAIDYLAYYAKYFNAVELDTTFHAVPSVERVTSWFDATPEDFRFCPKTPKAITHDSGVPLDRAVDAMHEFLAVMSHLREKLGVVLIQFPPSFAAREATMLRRFMRALPAELRFAIEFRHESWFSESTVELLRGLGCCWVSADYAHEPRQIRPISDFLYIRWIGEHRRFTSMDRQRLDLSDELMKWKAHIDPLVPKLSTVWGFFNNDYAGFAVATCRQFMGMVGEPVPPAEGARQGQLFEDVDVPVKRGRR